MGDVWEGGLDLNELFNVFGFVVDARGVVGCVGGVFEVGFVGEVI